jgi:hypothetical protein
MILLLTLGSLTALMLAGCAAVRGGYESAPFRTARKDGRFELRDYPALAVVETSMSPGGGDDGSFMRLFRFITGANQGEQKIAMTTPVFISGGPTNGTMAFVMPAKLKPGDVPRPTDAQLRVRELEGGRFAVLRFSGGRSARNESEALARLRAWVESQGLQAVSSPIYGYFDPPWTPSFLRRNEAMLRVAE